MISDSLYDETLAQEVCGEIESVQSYTIDTLYTFTTSG